MRRWWREALRAHEVHAARHDLSGREALAARQALRWRDGRLVGELLPDRPCPGRARS